MSDAIQSTRLRAAITAFVLAAVVAAVGLAWTSNAEAACAGSNCLPGSGYTYDTTWSCLSSGNPCWGTGGHTYGWASASYSGGGNTAVCVGLWYGDSTRVSGCGTNLARICYLSTCNDQSTVYLTPSASTGGERHTVNGHAKA